MVFDHVLGGQGLVGEAHVHDCAGMPLSRGQVDQAAFTHQVETTAIGQDVFVQEVAHATHLDGQCLQRRDVDLHVEVAGVRHDGTRLHDLEVMPVEHVDITGGGDEDVTLGRGFTGVVKAEAVERLYHQRLGGVMLSDLPIPFYADIWEIDHNRLLYLGSETAPAMRLARLVRAAISLPVFMQPLEIDGALCGDGGVINIFPAQPLVDHHPEIDFFIGVNCFYPENFAGEDHSGWQERNWSVLRVSPQPRHSQHLELARMQLSLIEDRCLLLHPVPYQEIKGVRFYELFADRSRWPEFILRGYYHTRRSLALLDRARA